MTYEEIFAKSKELILPNDASEFKDHIAVEVDTTGEGEGAFYIELVDGKINMEPYEYYDYDCKLIISGSDFIEMCKGELDPVKAFTNGKLKIKGDIDKALKVSKIFNAVKAKNAAPKTDKKKDVKPAKAED